MQARENLCSLKSRNNCIMRRKIVDIYKALRHFNVTAGEVRDIAEGYRYWIANPFESRPPFNTVYFMDGKLYSMPYPKKSLASRFVGIEINGVVYLTPYIIICKDSVDVWTQKLKAKTNNFEAIDQFKLRTPTRDEAKILAERVVGNNSLTGICNKYCNVWITPTSNHPERTFVTLREHSARPHQPSKNTQAALYLVTCPDDEQIFYGEVDEYGTPTPETQEVYKKFFESPLPLNI